MTEAQIEKNAEQYAKKHEKVLNYHHDEPETDFEDKKNTYIAGAHSRDNEVEMLQNQIEELSEQLKMNAENIQKLRNPWISVEDKLPEKTKGIFSCEVQELEKDKIVYYKDTRGYIHTGYLNAKNHWRDLDRDNAAIYSVTHWMPII